MFPQVRMTHAHLPLLLHPLQKKLTMPALWGTWKRAASCLCGVCVCVCVCVCVYRSTLRRSTRKWVHKPPAAGLRAVEGGGSSPLRYVAPKTTSMTSSQFCFCFFSHNRLLSNMETVSSLWLHSSLPAQQVCSFFNSPVPSLHSPLTCAVEQQSAAACTLCNLRYQRWACLFVWRKRWANSAGYVLTVQCCLSALTLLRVRWLQAPRVCTSLRRRAVSQVMQEG